MGAFLGGWIYGKRFKRSKVLCIGDLVLIKSEDKTTLSLEVDDLFEKIEHEQEVSFRVKMGVDSAEEA